MFDFARARDGAPIEGFLGDCREAKVLFILREPDSADQQEFWFRKVLDDAQYRRGRAPKYADTLSALARYLLGDPDAIRSCAYINLYAASGGGSASKLYRQTYRAYQGMTVASDEAVRRAAQVKELIRDFILSGTQHIVTVNDIYDLLRSAPPAKVIRAEDAFADSEKLTIAYRYSKRAPKTFRLCRCEIYGRSVTLHEFWHPAYPAYSVTGLREAIPDCFD